MGYHGHNFHPNRSRLPQRSREEIEQREDAWTRVRRRPRFYANPNQRD